MKLEISTEFNAQEIQTLYEAVGWSAYTKELNTLLAGLQNSDRVVLAREAGELVGLARVISDGYTIAYLQDILVHPKHQRSGLGRKLVMAALEPYSLVRQTVLLTDDEPSQRAFYEALGFTESRDFDSFQLRAFVKFNF